MTRLLPVGFLLLLVPVAVSAGSGFYLGGSGAMHWIEANGTWGENEFRATELFEEEDDGVDGLAWVDHFVIGVQPVLGYRFDERFALQVGADLYLPKSSLQTYSEGDYVTYLEQSIQVDWKQRSLEITALVRPVPEGRFYVYGGWVLSSIDLDIAAYDVVTYSDPAGNEATSGELEAIDDTVGASGPVLGAGFEFPSQDGRSVAYLAAEYGSVRTHGNLFGLPDWDVNAGGFSVMAGVRWFPFAERTGEEAERRREHPGGRPRRPLR